MSTTTARGETQKRNLLSLQSRRGGEDVAIQDTKVVVIGGSGRVGGSTVRALRQLLGPNVELVVGGRSERNFVNSVKVRYNNTIVQQCKQCNVRCYQLLLIPTVPIYSHQHSIILAAPLAMPFRGTCLSSKSVTQESVIARNRHNT